MLLALDMKTFLTIVWRRGKLKVETEAPENSNKVSTPRENVSDSYWGKQFDKRFYEGFINAKHQNEQEINEKVYILKGVSFKIFPVWETIANDNDNDNVDNERTMSTTLMMASVSAFVVATVVAASVNVAFVVAIFVS